MIATPADLLVRNIGVLATLAGPCPRVGEALRDLALVEGAALAASDGRIVYAGPQEGLAQAVTPAVDATLIDAGGAAVIPGFVDAHTHAVFAGNRDDEIRQRLAGVSYAEIARSGGGIVRTVAATRGLAEDLLHGLLARLDQMLQAGTTTAEVKSGYGLETAAEIRSLEAVAEAARTHPVALVPTFLGAHEVPPEHRENRQRYLDILRTEMLPEVARRGLARFCDVFCEEGVFTISESRLLLETALAHGFELRVHADELVWTGGAELAAELGARSADHLVFVSEIGMRDLARSSCVATLLPSAAFYLRLPRYAPARALVQAGAVVALASDTNPGGGLSPSMPFAMTVGCFALGLSLEEALAASTLNAAFSLGVHEDVGSLEVGKSADLLILRSPRLLDLLRVGVPAIRTVVKAGRVVVRDSRPVES